MELKAVILKAAEQDNDDRAFKMIQDALGVESGDTAGRFAEKWEDDNDLNIKEFWWRGLQVHRVKVLEEYVNFEQREALWRTKK